MRAIAAACMLGSNTTKPLPAPNLAPHDPRVTGTVRGDLAGGRAADQRDLGREASDPAEQGGKVVGLRREDNDQLPVLASDSQLRRLRAGSCRIGVGGAAHAKPSGGGGDGGGRAGAVESLGLHGVDSL